LSRKKKTSIIEGKSESKSKNQTITLKKSKSQKSRIKKSKNKNKKIVKSKNYQNQIKNKIFTYFIEIESGNSLKIPKNGQDSGTLMR
jgi:hypothetical protein